MADDFICISNVPNVSTDVKDTTKLLIFIWGINDRFKIVEEFLAMESMAIRPVRQSMLYQDALRDWTCNGLHCWTWPLTKLIGQNIRLLHRNQDRVREDSPNLDLIVLRCIIHQESLCKSVLPLDHVAKTVVKLVNFIKARGHNHRQYSVTLLSKKGYKCAVMNLYKSRFISQLTDKHLSYVLQISTSDMTLDFDGFAKRSGRLNCFH